MQGLGLRGWQGAGVGLTVGRLNSGILTNYLYKPGLAGGQTAHGGNATGEELHLRGNSVDANSIVQIDSGRLSITNPDTGIVLAVSPTASGIAVPIALDVNASTAVTTANHTLIRTRGVAQLTGNIRQTVLDHGGTTLKTGTGVPFVLFDVGPTFKFQGAQSAGQLFFFAPVYKDDGSIRTITASTRAIILQPNYAALTAGSTGNASTLTGIEATPTVDSSWTAMSFVRLVALSNPGGTHAVGITDLVGLDIPDGISKPTNVWSIRNVEGRARMHHRGSIYLGGGATPTQETNSLLRVTAGSAGGHGSITFDEEAVDGPLPTLDNQARVYVKNNKIVIQWNLGGANLWTWALLNPAGPYPVATAWVTDVVAP